MTTLGWIFLLLALLVGRSAARGRGVQDVPGDVGDLILAAVRGDYDGVQAVLDRRGDVNEPAATPTGGGLTAGATGGAAAGVSGPGKGAAVLADAKRISRGATYVLGATGPKSFDCSGLVYRAMQNAIGYTGPRFTTATWPSVGGQIAIQTTTPQEGDIVLWPGHMGIVDGPSTFFSALSPQSGIKSIPMNYLTKQKGAQPSFWRLK